MRLQLIFLVVFTLSLSLPTTLAAASSCDASDLSQAPPNASVVSCKKTIFNDETNPSGDSAIPATFNPKTVGALTQKPTEILWTDDSPIYQRELQKDYGVKDVKRWAELAVQSGDPDPNVGISMLQKFSTVVNMTPGSERLLKYVTTEMYENNRKSQDKKLDSSTGNCRIWSAWSMDPEVQAIFKKAQEGIFCEGISFTRGELAELMNAVYPEPGKNLKTAILNKSGVYDPKSGHESTYASFEAVEDANLALAALGEFGVPSQDHTKDLAKCANAEKTGVTSDALRDSCGRSYSENPSMFIEMAAAAKAKKSTLMMDLDGGTIDTWNQPIEQVIDISYVSASCINENADVYLSARSLQPNEAEGSAALIAQIKVAEAKLKEQALQGNATVSATMGNIYKALNRSVPSSADLVSQVNVLKVYQVNLLRQNKFSAPEKKVVRHKLIVKYGGEADVPGQRFDINPETGLSSNTKTRVLDYVTVNGQSSWLPPSRKLSTVCAKRAEGVNAMGNRVVNRGVDPTDDNGKRTGYADPYGFVAHGDDAHMNYACKRLANREIPDRDFVTGAFPPKNLQTYTPFLADGTDKRFSPNDPKLPAYNFLKNMILNCDQKGASFHQASVFVNHLHQKISTNSLSSSDVTRFANEYKRLRSHSSVDEPEDFVDGTNKFLAGVGGDAQQITNLSALYQRISQ